MKNLAASFESLFLIGCLLIQLAPSIAAHAQVNHSQTELERVLAGAYQQIGQTIYYDGAYKKLSYPGGDVAFERGVCTDVVVRAFRNAGIDLQVLVHEDMKAAFNSYPKNWGLKRPDPNIDHRRVPNLMKFFKRKGKSKTITRKGSDYLPGDIVAWRLPNGLPHIGLVSDKKTTAGNRFRIVHNIGAGTQLEDVLFEFEIIGHYRWF